MDFLRGKKRASPPPYFPNFLATHPKNQTNTKGEVTMNIQQ